MLSVLDIFRIGIGPSSSHTVGPIRICKRFVDSLHREGLFEATMRVEITLQGSLALTGVGHATPKACILGLMGLEPETLDPDSADAMVARVEGENILSLGGARDIGFDPTKDLIFDYETIPELHPNGMVLRAYDAADKGLREQTYYSTGGGFIASKHQLETPLKDDIVPGVNVPHPFGSADELLEICATHSLAIHEVILANEDAMRPREETQAALDRIAQVMMACIERGLNTEGILPGGLEVKRRAPAIWEKLHGSPMSNEREQLFDWLNVFAMAVNEENAAGGQVVTAPTNGAAGILPSVLRYYCAGDPIKNDRNIRKFLLTAGGIGLLYKQRASISGAEMGCQGEVGVACSMAAGGLAAVWGATPLQVTSAAEIGMEHNLGLTCDPVGGLVQIPCIERNAIGAVKAVNAARLALHASEKMKVSLDQVIETMRQTGLDMSTKYKETSQGGLAVNVVEC